MNGLKFTQKLRCSSKTFLLTSKLLGSFSSSHDSEKDNLGLGKSTTEIKDLREKFEDSIV